MCSCVPTYLGPTEVRFLYVPIPCPLLPPPSVPPCALPPTCVPSVPYTAPCVPLYTLCSPL